MVKATPVRAGGWRAPRCPWVALPMVFVAVTSLPAAEINQPIHAIFDAPASANDPLAAIDDADRFADQPVAKRRRPDYDPRGAHLGGFLVFPSLSIAEKYDDNIFATSSDRAGDFATVISPSISVESNWSRHGLGLQAFGVFTEFADHSTESTQQGGLNLTGRFDIAPEDYVSGFLAYAHEAEPRSEEDTTGGRHPSIFNHYIARTRYGHQFNRLELRLDAQLQRFDFTEGFDADRDRLELGLTPRLSYQVSSHLTTFIQGGYVSQNYDAPGDTGGANPNSQTYDAMAGVGLAFAPMLTGEIAAGVFHSEFDHSTFDPITSPAVDGSLIWNVTRLTTITGAVSRQQKVTTEADSSSKIASTASLRVDHELMRNVVLSGELDYQHDDYQGIDRTDDRIDILVGGKYLVNRNAAILLGYQYTNRNSNVDTEDFTDNVVRLGVELHM